jgi:hypothetical protein
VRLFELLRGRCGLQSSWTVLDIGCDCGRVAMVSNNITPRIRTVTFTMPSWPARSKVPKGSTPMNMYFLFVMKPST